MDAAAVTPQMLTIGSLIALLLVALAARYCDQCRHTHDSHHRFGNDHSGAITEMGNRTRDAAQGQERERMAATSPHQGR